MKRAKIVGTYRLNEGELIQFTIEIPTNYPDALNEAKAQVVAAVREQLADVMTQTRGE